MTASPELQLRGRLRALRAYLEQEAALLHLNLLIFQQLPDQTRRLVELFGHPDERGNLCESRGHLVFGAVGDRFACMVRLRSLRVAIFGTVLSDITRQSLSVLP